MVSQNINLTERISEALLNDPRTKDAAVDIAFNQGILTLSGVVKSHTVMDAVEDIAKKQPGVISVINEMRVA